MAILRNQHNGTVDLVEKKIEKMNSRSKELNSSKETVFCRKSKETGNGNLMGCQVSSFNRDIVAGWEEIETHCDLSRINGEQEDCTDKNRMNSEINLNRCRDRLLEEASETVPEPGSGRVMHLVKAFEELSIYKLGNPEEEVQVMENALQQPLKVSEMQDSSLFPSEFHVTSSGSLDLDSGLSSSMASSQESNLTQTSDASRKSGLSSPESAEIFPRRHWWRRPRAT